MSGVENLPAGEPDPTADAEDGMPRWVKVFLVVGVVLVALLLIGKVTGIGGEHGPNMHGGGDRTESDGGGNMSPSDH